MQFLKGDNKNFGASPNLGKLDIYGSHLIKRFERRRDARSRKKPTSMAE